MPFKKPKTGRDINIGANGLREQKGRRAKTVDIKVVKLHKDHPDIMNRLAKRAEEVAAQKAREDAEKD